MSTACFRSCKLVTRIVYMPMIANLQYGRAPFVALILRGWGDIFSIFLALCADTFRTRNASAKSGMFNLNRTRRPLSPRADFLLPKRKRRHAMKFKPETLAFALALCACAGAPAAEL